jgi:hypothetical protein
MRETANDYRKVYLVEECINPDMSRRIIPEINKTTIDYATNVINGMDFGCIQLHLGHKILNFFLQEALALEFLHEISSSELRENEEIEIR